ncbi:hypothetical protein [Streptomyces sp. sk2.1]|uniref:hypothetical protein n=1 Tax=Streptomyces sp. sk2.1 TaxID=2478959 RepID=UPI0011E6843E|nr:hypothetical protein [Streptomyces sp. sk2.1]TXS77748.1 hypothetical protein EAO76_04530 [Streptomyces sp. sk2.1]
MRIGRSRVVVSAGPGGADRVWTRIAVAPDGGCAKALDPLLVRVLCRGRGAGWDRSPLRLGTHPPP